jgi:hypothetical protein
MSNVRDQENILRVRAENTSSRGGRHAGRPGRGNQRAGRDRRGARCGGRCGGHRRSANVGSDLIK